MIDIVWKGKNETSKSIETSSLRNLMIMSRNLNEVILSWISSLVKELKLPASDLIYVYFPLKFSLQMVTFKNIWYHFVPRL
jgi:hypothetical protein